MQYFPRKIQNMMQIDANHLQDSFEKASALFEHQKCLWFFSDSPRSMFFSTLKKSRKILTQPESDHSFRKLIVFLYPKIN